MPSWQSNHRFGRPEVGTCVSDLIANKLDILVEVSVLGMRDSKIRMRAWYRGVSYLNYEITQESLLAFANLLGVTPCTPRSAGFEKLLT